MAREPGIRYLHITYEAAPDENGVVREHELRNGNECWCEPKCVRADRTIIVVHDPEDGIVVVEDANARPENPHRYPGPYGE